MFDKNENHHTVPVSMMLKHELANGKVERPQIVRGQVSQSKKGEDFTLVKTECQRVVRDGVSTYSVFGSLWQVQRKQLQMLDLEMLWLLQLGRDDGVDFNCASFVCLDETKAWIKSTRCRSC